MLNSLPFVEFEKIEKNCHSHIVSHHSRKGGGMWNWNSLLFCSLVKFCSRTYTYEPSFKFRPIVEQTFFYKEQQNEPNVIGVAILGHNLTFISQRKNQKLC